MKWPHLAAALVGATVSATIAVSAFAAVSADEAKGLGTTLTPWGAEKAGNKEGTIPAYSGERVKAPAGWDRKKQGFPDTFGEKPAYTITAQNAAQYADKLDGMLEVFKKYPNFRMDIYPTHRTVNYPKYVLDNTYKNATGCKGSADERKLVGCYAGVPFPIPKTGLQVMWNRLMYFGSYSLTTDYLPTWVIPRTGNPILQTANQLYEQFAAYDPALANKVMVDQDDFFLVRIDTIDPPRAAGTKYIFKYSVDVGNGSRAWVYIPGQRRVKLSPDLAYDTPSPLSGGAQLMDEGQVINGGLERFDYKLVGKKEKFMMYNNGALTDPRVCPDSKVVSTKSFPNPDCVRWELHRVWAVEATLRSGFRHVYKRRMYFFDEDTFTGTTEGYDATGALYRIVNNVHYPFFEGGFVSTSTMEMDLLTGIWTYQGSYGVEGGAFYPSKPHDKVFFSPEALAGEGIR